MQLISKIIPSGGLSYTTLLKVKVTALIYCISSAGTVPKYELVLSKLGNNFEGSSKHLLHQYHPKIHTLAKATATNFLVNTTKFSSYITKLSLPPCAYVCLLPSAHLTVIFPCVHLELQWVGKP